MFKKKRNTEKIKKPFYKKWWFWLIIILFVFPAFIDGDNSSENNQNKGTAVENADSKEEKVKEDKVKEDKAKEDKVKEDKAKEKKAKEGKVKEDKAEVATEEPYEIEDDIAIFTDDNDSIFSAKQHVDSFSAEMTQALKENHKDIKNGAIFRSVKTLSDKYGNEEKTNVLAVYYSPETIEKINYDKWPTLDASGLYDTADAMWAHPAFKEKGAKENKSGTENAPDIYFNYLGSTVE